VKEEEEEEEEVFHEGKETSPVKNYELRAGIEQQARIVVKMVTLRVRMISDSFSFFNKNLFIASFSAVGVFKSLLEKSCLAPQTVSLGRALNELRVSRCPLMQRHLKLLKESAECPTVRFFYANAYTCLQLCQTVSKTNAF